jgi:hypothetical protein
VRPLDDAAAVNGKRATALEAVAALRRPVPDALGLAEAEDGEENEGAEDVPGAGDAQSPLSVQVPLLIDDNVHVPDAADLRDPTLRSLGRGVGDGNAVNVGVLVGDGCQVLECLFRDWSRWLVARLEELSSYWGWARGGHIHGQPQWRRKTMIVRRPSGSGISGDDGAFDPGSSLSATSLCSGVLRLASSCEYVDCGAAAAGGSVVSTISSLCVCKLLMERLLFW